MTFEPKLQENDEILRFDDEKRIAEQLRKRNFAIANFLK